MLKQGQSVYIEATVMHLYHADREPAYQSVGVQLKDGQHVMTNVANVQAPPDVAERARLAVLLAPHIKDTAPEPEPDRPASEEPEKSAAEVNKSASASQLLHESLGGFPNVSSVLSDPNAAPKARKQAKK